MSNLKLFLLGSPRVELDGKVVDIQRRKALALLVYLAVSGQAQGRDVLATLFWPDYTQQRARAYLRRDLAVLKNSLSGEWLLADWETVDLNREAGLWLDVAHFRDLIRRCQTHPHPSEENCPECLQWLAEAAGLYNDDFLAGFTLRDSSEFDDWQFFQAESLRQELGQVLERLVRRYTSQGQPEEAIPYARRWLALDPLHEPAQRALMQLYDGAGQLAAALRQYEEYVVLLEEELGLPPEEETRTLYEAIKAKRLLGAFLKSEEQAGKIRPELTAQDAAPVRAKKTQPEPWVPEERAPVSTPPSPPVPSGDQPLPQHNLPVQNTAFIGREAELAEIRRLLVEEENCRLLNLVGPGGTGKTRLALEVASNALKQFPDGVYWVSLALVREEEFIASAIAKVLRVNLSGPTAPKSQLLDYLQDKKLLLLIDNFEHLLENVALLSELLEAAPHLKLLVTSQERLNLQEEWVYEVPGMKFPKVVKEWAEADLPALEGYGAIRFFLQYARRAEASFALTAEDIPAVIRICQLVDGLPLGLELAASWVRSMSCQEIAREVEQNLDFLTTSKRNVPERHRSLRAVFEQTWQRLSATERGVLNRLSVFQGDYSREAAEAVAGSGLSLLAALVDRALLRRTSHERYEMHELVRQFAAEQLAASPDEQKEVHQQHCAYYTSFLEKRAADLKGRGQKEALAAIAVEMDNIRVAWQWATAHKDAPALEKSAEPFWIFSEYRGALHEGELAFRQAVAAFGAASEENGTGEAPAGLAAFLVAGLGYLSARLGKLKEGLELMEQGITRLRQLSPRDKPKEAFALMALGSVLITQGRSQEAGQLGQDCLALFTEIGDRWGRARCIRLLSNAAQWSGQLDEAEQLWQNALTASKEIGDDRVGYPLINLGLIALARGAYPQAKQYIEEGIRVGRELGDLLGTADGLRERGALATAEGQYPEAIQILQESLTLYEQIGRSNVGAAFNYLGTVLRLQGHFEEAEQWYQKSLVASTAAANQPETAACLRELGCLAYDRRTYHQAEHLLQQSLDIWEQVQHEPELAAVRCYLGHILAALGGQREAEAREQFKSALRLALKHRLAPVALEVFLGLAGLQARTGETRSAAELLALAETHPAGRYETRTKAGQFRQAHPSLEVELGAQRPEAASDWQAVATQLLEEPIVPVQAAPQEPDETPSVDLPPFVGRDHEYKILLQAVAQVHKGQGQVILIQGEPGIGKSRLAQEAARYAQGQGMSSLWQKCYPSEQGMPYQVLIDLVGQMLAAWPVETFRNVPPTSLAELALLVPEITTLFPHVPPLPSSLAEARQARLFRALQQFVVAPAAQKPLMLVMDDIQWADQVTLQFLYHLVHHLDNQPVFLVCTYRAEEVAGDEQLATTIHSLWQKPHAARLTLSRLSLQDINTLVELLPAIPHATTLAGWLHRETAGNPFFLISILQSLEEQGVLTAESETGWQLDPRSLQEANTRLTLPDALRQSVRDRLRRVPQQARHILDVAAVYGRRFDFATLQAITRENGIALLDAAEALIQRQLLREEEKDGTYDFNHDKIREVVYHDLSRMRRVLLHRQVAEALEALDNSWVGRLAEHFEKGEVWTKAINYLAQAAGRARELFAMPEALNFYDEAIVLAVKHPEAITQPVLLDLYEQRGETRGLMGGQVAEAVADLELVLDAAREMGDRERERVVLIRIGQVYRYGDNYEEALKYLKAALEVARRSGDERSVADALYHLGTTVWSQGNNKQALIYHQEAVEICQRLNLDDLVAVQAYHGLGEAYFLAARATEAIELYETSLELARQIRDKGYESENLGNIGMAMQVYGIADYDGAREVFTRALRISQAAHLEWHSTQILGPLGLSHGLSGNYRQALENLNKSLRIAESIGAKRFHSLMLDMQGIIWQELNLLEKAKAAHEQGVRLAQEAGAGWWLPRIRANLAIDRLRLGELEVEEELQQTLAEAMDRHLETHAVRCLEGLAELALAQDQPQQTLDYTERLLQLAEPGGLREVVAQAHRWRGEALLALSELAQAATELEQALALAKTIGRPRLEWDLHAALARLCRARGDEAAALQHDTQVRQIVSGVAGNLEDPAMQVEPRSGTGAAGETPQPSGRQREAEAAERLSQEISFGYKPEAIFGLVGGRFVQETLIATGGMGEVYRGWDTETGQRVVIKRLKSELSSRNPEAVKRLIREGEVLRLLNHPNIVKVLTTLEAEGQPVVVMEYIPGGSLRDHLDRQAQLSLDYALSIGLELADALARVHHLNIIHRDLKPANVLLAEDGSPRLTDFGVAYLARQETRLTREGEILGTTLYMSPEAWRGEALDARSDVWSFGAVMYEMLAGQPPFEAPHVAAIMTAILNDPLPDLLQFRPDVPPPLVELIRHMLAKERELRIDSMRQVAAGLELIRRSVIALADQELT